MKITSIVMPRILNRVAFGSVTKPYPNDSVQFSGKVYKETEIQDLNGNSLKAKILKIGEPNSNTCTFKLMSGEKTLGEAQTTGAPNAMEGGAISLEHLFVKNHTEREYKGIGTELLKCVVEHSQNMGYKGRVITCARHNPPPFVFYYKNNFRATNDAYNAPIEYAAKMDMPVEDVCPTINCGLNMVLDEEGAKALLSGNKLYKDSELQEIEKKNIDGIEYTANLLRVPNQDSYRILVTNNGDNGKLSCTVNFTTVEDEQGKHFKINQAYDEDLMKIFRAKQCNEVTYFAKDAVDLAAKEFGYGKTEDCSIKS